MFAIGRNFEESGFGIGVIRTSRHEFGMQPSDSDFLIILVTKQDSSRAPYLSTMG